MSPFFFARSNRKRLGARNVGTVDCTLTFLTETLNFMMAINLYLYRGGLHDLTTVAQGKHTNGVQSDFAKLAMTKIIL